MAKWLNIEIHRGALIKKSLKAYLFVIDYEAAKWAFWLPKGRAALEDPASHFIDLLIAGDMELTLFQESNRERTAEKVITGADLAAALQIQ